MKKNLRSKVPAHEKRQIPNSNSKAISFQHRNSQTQQQQHKKECTPRRRPAFRMTYWTGAARRLAMRPRGAQRLPWWRTIRYWATELQRPKQKKKMDGAVARQAADAPSVPWCREVLGPVVHTVSHRTADQEAARVAPRTGSDPAPAGRTHTWHHSHGGAWAVPGSAGGTAMRAA